MYLFSTLVLLAISWADNDEIDIVHPHVDGERDHAHHLMQQFGDMYYKETGVKVNFYPTNWYTLLNDLDKNKSQGRGQDLVVAGNDWMGKLWENNIIRPLDDFYDEMRETRGKPLDLDFIPGQEFLYRYPLKSNIENPVNVWYAIPFDHGTTLIYYRDDLYQKYNLSAPTTLQTVMYNGRKIWEETLKDPTQPTVMGFALPDVVSTNAQVARVTIPFVQGSGTSFLTENGTCNLASDSFMNAFAEYLSSFHGPSRQHDMRDFDATQAAQAFGDGNVSHVILGGEWLFNSHVVPRARTKGFLNHIKTAHPSGKMGGPYSFIGGSGWVIPTWVPSHKLRKLYDFLKKFIEPFPSPNDKYRTMTHSTYATACFAANLYPVFKKNAFQNYAGTTEPTCTFRSIRIKAKPVNTQTAVTVELNKTKLTHVGCSAVETENVREVISLDKSDRWDLQRDFLTCRAPTSPDKEYVSLDLSHVGTDLHILSYSIQTNAHHPEYDPVLWELEGSNDLGTTWVPVHQQDIRGLMPWKRLAYCEELPIPSNISSYKQFRLAIVSVRGEYCKSYCGQVNKNLGYAVPLTYPLTGFYKISRLQSSGVLPRFVYDSIHATSPTNTSHDIAKLYCNEVNELFKDPVPEDDPQPNSRIVAGLAIGCVALCCLLLFLILWLFYQKKKSLQNAPIANSLITFVFTEAEDTLRLRTLHKDIAHSAVSIHDTIIRSNIKKHRGYQFKATDGAYYLAFKSPLAAVKFSVDTQFDLFHARWPEKLLNLDGFSSLKTENGFRGLRVKFAVHSGWPQVVRKVDGGFEYLGDAVSMTEMLRSVTHFGQIVSTQDCYYQIEAHLDAVRLSPKSGVRPLGTVDFEGLPRTSCVELSPLGIDRDFSCQGNSSSRGENSPQKSSPYTDTCLALSDIKFNNNPLQMIRGPGDEISQTIDAMLRIRAYITETYPEAGITIPHFAALLFTLIPTESPLKIQTILLSSNIQGEFVALESDLERLMDHGYSTQQFFFSYFDMHGMPDASEAFRSVLETRYMVCVPWPCVLGILRSFNNKAINELADRIGVSGANSVGNVAAKYHTVHENSNFQPK